MVYERDAALASRPQGYRLHVDARAGLALQRCLSPELFRLYLATCGRPGQRLTVMSERLRVLHEQAADPARDPFAPATLSTSVNRQTLREVLAAGLGRQISFGRELTGYAAGDDGVRLHFADGWHADADLLVGADGVTSVVRRQYLPDAEVMDTGIPEQACAAIAPGVRLSPAGDYLMWAVAADRGRFGVPDDRLAELDPAGLHGIATKMIRSWHPDLRGLLALADTRDTFLVRIRTSVPRPAWAPGAAARILAVPPAGPRPAVLGRVAEAAGW